MTSRNFKNEKMIHNTSKVSMLIGVLSVIALLSCSKSGKEDTDRQAPVVTLVNPQDQQVFTSASMINITGTVTANKYIKEIHIEISDLTTGEEYQHIHIHPASASYSFNQGYQLKPATSYRIRVIADDANSNSSVSKAEIRCN